MNLRSCKQKNNRERGCRRVLPFFLQGLQRENVWLFEKGLKGIFVLLVASCLCFWVVVAC
jgi:hypothetical protein